VRLKALYTDIHHVACWLQWKSSNFACWTSIFCPERRLRPGPLLQQSGSDREAAVFWFDGNPMM
jgi:hypothetical protein